MVTALRLLKRDCGRQMIKLLWGGTCFTNCVTRNCSVVSMTYNMTQTGKEWATA
jgi:hypothetical protein